MFASARPDVVRALARECSERTLAKGEVLFFESDPGSSMYAVASGRMKLGCTSRDGGQVTFGFVGPGATFGELSAIDGAPRSATAEALELSRVVAIPADALRSALRADPALAESLLVALAGRLRATTLQHSELVFLDLSARVMAFLVRRAGPDGVVELGVSQGDLAAIVGGSRQSVNQVLRELENAGTIRRRGRRMEILDRRLIAAEGSEAP